MTRNPFCVAEDILSDNLQEEFLELKCNSIAKDDFEVMPQSTIFGQNTCTYIKTLVVQPYGSYFRFRPLTFVKWIFYSGQCKNKMSEQTRLQSQYAMYFVFNKAAH